MNAIHVFTSTLSLVAAVSLTACGGDEITSAAAMAPQDHAGATRVTVEAPLLDDEGQATLAQPAAVPADPGARTRSTGYATRTQAAALEQALGSKVLNAEVGCCGTEAADLAVLAVYRNQSTADLPRSTPVLVRGADQRLAATVAQRLADNGFSRVWLVAQ